MYESNCSHPLLIVQVIHEFISQSKFNYSTLLSLSFVKTKSFLDNFAKFSYNFPMF